MWPFTESKQEQKEQQEAICKQNKLRDKRPIPEKHFKSYVELCGDLETSFALGGKSGVAELLAREVILLRAEVERIKEAE